MTTLATLAARFGNATRRRTPLADFWGLMRQRAALARLDDDALEDIGLTAEDARSEAARPVWDVPAHWRR